MQLTTAGKEIWRAARKTQQLEEAGAGDVTVKERLQKLRLVDALRKRGAVWSEIQSLVGISRATYYRWKRRLQEEGLKGLKPKSRRPKHLRQKVYWTPELLIAIEALRKRHPTWGRWPIWLALRKRGFPVSERTVGRILAYLEAHGRVLSVASFLARARRGKQKRRARRPYARRKPRAYQVNHPGDLGPGGHPDRDLGARGGGQTLLRRRPSLPFLFGRSPYPGHGQPGGGLLVRTPCQDPLPRQGHPGGRGQ